MIPDRHEASASDRRTIVICNVDGTICTDFDRPLLVAVKTLQQIPRLPGWITVHYVTSRARNLRATTQGFLNRNRMPDADNVHMCPPDMDSLEYKSAVMQALAREYSVWFSIGDAEEDEQASRAAGVRFVRVDPSAQAAGWRVVQQLLKEG